MGQTSNQQIQGQNTQPTPVVKETTEITFLSGYKTYIIAVAMIVYAILGYYLKQDTYQQMWQLIFNGLGLIGLRSGIESLKNIV